MAYRRRYTRRRRYSRRPRRRRRIRRLGPRYYRTRIGRRM